MMLWMTQFFPEEDWARTQKERCLGMLDRMWLQEGLARLTRNVVRNNILAALLATAAARGACHRQTLGDGQRY
jgi:hypothetical protein